MFQKLVNHNADIRALVEKGYAIGFDSGYLIVRDVPYLDNQRGLQWGAFVAKLVFSDQEHVVQDDHQIFFAGSEPHSLDGTPIPNLGGGPTPLALSAAAKDVVVQRRFSNKPRGAGKFSDFFEKVESYVAIVSGPAMSLHGVSPLTFRAVGELVADSVFKIHDTLTSRAEIGDLSRKFEGDVVAVIGLGGTGSYLLDFLVKTPVREIRAYDPDLFYVHNAFRSPGKVELSELGKGKADIYARRYENFRDRLHVKPMFVDGSCAAEFDGVTFAFVCVDKGPSRSGIFDLLISKGIPFIDVGMGLKRQSNVLNGMLRATYFSKENAQAIREKKLAEMSDGRADIYRTHIQIGELNAMNACMAIVRFKQLRGFYFEETPYFHQLLVVGDFKTIGEAELT